MMEHDNLPFPWEEDESKPASQQHATAEDVDTHAAETGRQQPPSVAPTPERAASPAEQAAPARERAASPPEPEARTSPRPAPAPPTEAPPPPTEAPPPPTEAPPPVRRGEATQRPVVRKEYYAISEVADLVGLPAHVLRYWESQFSVLNPSKNRSGNRVYQRKEIKLILLVKQLLHDEKYTVEGAKQKLEQLRRGGALGESTTRALDQQLVAVLRDELLRISELLTEPVE
jgi:DNA-binding transcriptional MerR regulator